MDFIIPPIRTLNLKRCSSWKKPLIVAASGFGLGCSPVAPGTAGTIPGVIIWLLIAGFPLSIQAAAAFFFILPAIYICDKAEKHFGVKDDPRIVADEFLTFPICMLGLAPHAWVIAMAFLTNRAMDIIKPPPARRLQNLPGGLGIVIDDVIASLYALLINHIIYRLVQNWIHAGV